jgi:mRNA interferase MazF
MSTEESLNKENLEQYSVWIVDLGQDFTKNDTFNSSVPLGSEQSGLRPVIIMSPTEYNNISGTPIVMCCSTSSKKSSNNYTIPVKWNDNHKPTWVNISQIRTFDKERFTYYAGKLKNEETIIKIKEGLNNLIFGIKEENKIINKCPTKVVDEDNFKIVVKKKRSNHK